MQITSRTNQKVKLHGRLATLKGVKWIDGVKCGDVWQGSSRYFIPMNEIEWA
jgi:hypothetical protein